MIPINLLPHRAAKRKAQQQQFLILAGATALVGAGIVVIVHGFLATRIDTQNSRNHYLEAETVKLDKQIDEIKKLKEQTQSLLARKRVVEDLQANRSEAVRLLDQLVRQLPDGLYLKQVKQTGDQVNIQGYATSNARVSTLMRNFEASPWIENPRLVEIKLVKLNNANLNEFNLNVKITRAKETAAVPEKKPAPGAPKPAAKQG
ncbi:MAG: fimbrial protein [Proteobacteria bacterium]|nr:MAG: fimbrial protein [Pseudomonadota bacterium]